MPLSLIEICETVEICVMFFNPRSREFNFQIVVQAKEPDEAVAAEDGRDRDVPGALQPPLKVLIDA